MLTKLKNLFRKFINYNWKLFFIKIYQKAKDDEIYIHAMGLVYTTLLSIIPFLIFSFYIMTLFNFFGGIENITEELRTIILNNLAAGTGETLINILESYVTGINIEQLGIISFLSLVLVVIFLLASVEITFNKIWGVEKHRDLFKRFVAFWTFITLGTFVITILISLSFTFLETLLTTEIADNPIEQSKIFEWITFSMNFILFILAYYFIPNTKVEPVAAIAGGITSGVLFILSKNLYGIYTRIFISYDQIYGSLTIIPIFLFWLYLIWLIVLIGAIISYVVNYRSNLNFISSSRQEDKELQHLLPIAILYIIYKNFQDKDKPGTEYNEIIKKINLPIKTIENTLKEMLKTNYLTKTEQDKYIPLTDLEKISFWSIYKEIILKNNPESQAIYADKEIEKIHQVFNQSIKEKLKDLTIKDIDSR
ncbi:MAG: YihY/virulence factor BrkB family protein [Bacillota bacterium]